MSTSTPTNASNQEIPEGYELIKEGTVSMLYPKSKNSVFYNPVQVQNRDLSILMISLYNQRRAKRKYIQKLKVTKKIKQNEAEELCKDMDWADYLQKTNNGYDGITILDALAASGLRSIRYHNEIAGVRKVIINDMEEAAINLAKENLQFNNVPENSNIQLNLGDALTLMYNGRTAEKKYDVIDLDPYGSAAPFLDAAMQAIADGGMLCVTCTDMAALGGSHPETCFGRYGSMPIQRARYLQEMALRILLNHLSRTAGVYGKTIRPVLSVGMAFYVRVFVEVYDDKAGVAKSSTKVGHVYQSTQCDSFYFIPQGIFNGRNYQPGRTATTNMEESKKKRNSKKKKNGKPDDSSIKDSSPQNNSDIKTPSGPLLHPLPYPFQCPETQAPFKIGGPIWLERLHNVDVVSDALDFLEEYQKHESSDATTSVKRPILQTITPLHGLLTSVSEELPDVPLYYTLPSLAHTLHCSSPSFAAFKAAIQNAGYEVSAYHKEPNAIKTTAPPDVIWDIMRHWCKLNPVKSKWLEGDKSVVAKILNRGMVELTEKDTTSETTTKNGDEMNSHKKSVDFTVYKKETRKKAQRYPMNPQKNWGPKPRAGSKRKVEQGEDTQKSKEKDENGINNTNDGEEPVCKKKNMEEKKESI